MCMHTISSIIFNSAVSSLTRICTALLYRLPTQCKRGIHHLTGHLTVMPRQYRYFKIVGCPSGYNSITSFFMTSPSKDRICMISLSWGFSAPQTHPRSLLHQCSPVKSSLVCSISFPMLLRLLTKAKDHPLPLQPRLWLLGSTLFLCRYENYRVTTFTIFNVR